MNIKRIITGMAAAVISVTMLATPAHAMGSSLSSSGGGFELPDFTTPSLPAFPPAPVPPAKPDVTPEAPSVNPPNIDKGVGDIIDGVKLNHDEAQLVRMINDYRVRNGLSPLTVSQEYMDMARSWSATQAKTGTMSHSHYNVFENVGVGFLNLAGFFALWQKSPEHNSNMLESSAKFIGVGAATDAHGRTFSTLILR